MEHRRAGVVTGADPLVTERFYVVMADVDAASILYYATPMRWTERLMSTWMREAGFPVGALLASGGGAPAVRAEIDYRRPLVLDDEVTGELRAVGHGRRSYTLAARFSTDDVGPAVEVQVTAVWVARDADGRMRSAELPERFLRALAGDLPTSR